jgi:diguanylate cyclase (GGDEF)-like protein
MHRVKAVPALVLAASIVAIGQIAFLQARSDASRRAQAELGQVGTQLGERSYAPLGAMFGTPIATLREQMAVLKREIRSTVVGLRADSPVPALDEVEQALARSFASDEANVALMGQMATTRGRAAIARALTGNDPTFNRQLLESRESSARVAAALGRAQAQYARRAARARLQATLGSAAAIALLLLAFGLAYRRSTRARGDAERLAHANARLAEANREEALTDALTGLGNRRALVDALDEALLDAAVAPIALSLFDLDGFKQYNDTFGHQAGDALLRRLGERLSERLGDRARAYRMGGDEFCVLASLEADDAVGIAELGAEALTEHGDVFSITCSYGIALAPSEAATAEEALRIADQRMYEAKAAGRRASATRQTTDVLLQVLLEQNDQLAEHVSSVARLAAMTAERLGMTEFEVRQVHIAAQLHDVGKSAIPDSILDKPGPLDEDEWEFIRRHTIIGERIVRAASSLSHAAPLIRSSHERVDGSGYPDRLRGDEIPLGAKIIAVCDAFDAMVAERSYRQGVSVEAALEELRRCAGGQFDVRVVGEFCRLAESVFGEALAA